MFLNIAISLLLVAALILLMWYLRGVMLTPVKKGKNQRIDLMLWVSGPSPELESTVDGLKWLVANGTIRARIVIIDDGMDKDTAAVAEALSRKGIAIFKGGGGS